jgi:hypothetical protein
MMFVAGGPVWAARFFFAHTDLGVNDRSSSQR